MNTLQQYSSIKTRIKKIVKPGRRVYAADISPYAKILTTAKLSSPPSLEEALNLAVRALSRAAKRPEPDLNNVPEWVKKFFHPKTLKEFIQFASCIMKTKLI